jgi:hypothetical protein
LFIGASGFVGIGTTNPREMLEVNGNIAANKFTDINNYDNYFLDLANADSNSSSLSLQVAGSIKFNSKYNSGTSQWTYLQAGPAIKIESFYDGTNGGLFLAASAIGAVTGDNINNTWNSGLFISGKSGTVGYVGIGTTAPTARLEIAGGTSSISNTSGDITINPASGLTDFAGKNIGNIQNGYFSGNVGIGTTNPGSLIDAYRSTTNGQVDVIRLSNAGYAYGSNALAWYNTDGLYTSARIYSEVGSLYTESKLYFDVADSGKTMQQRMVIDVNGSVGIGTTAPKYKLDIVGDALISTRLGIGSTNALYALNVGTSSNFANLFTSGSVGIGSTGFDATNPEKLLVDAGITSSVNVISGKGSINNYLQLNIQNRSTGTSASSDIVATADNGSETTNFIDMGINGSGYTNGIFGGANDGYLYNIGGNMNIGTGTAGKSIAFLTGGSSVTTNTRMFINSNGNVGIGTTNPGYLLHIEGSGTSGVTFLKNTGTGASTPVLVLQTNVGVTQATTAGEFIRFLNSAGTKLGRIRVGTTNSVVFSTSATNDFAEYVNGDEPTEPTDLVAYHGDKFGKARDGEIIAGTHSNYATFVGNENIADQQYAFPLALVGVVDVKVSSQNGNINAGDPISTSQIAGVGAKAIKAGRIVGRAIENYSNSNPNNIGSVKILIQPNWYDPDISLTETGQVNVSYNISPEVLNNLGYNDSKNEIESASYQLNDSFGRPITRLAQFAKISSAKIVAGLISTTNLIADNIIAKKVITPELKTTTITPLDEITDTIVIDGNLKAREASFSTVYADQIINKDGNISDVMAQKISELRAEITSLMATSDTATPSAIAIASTTWDTSVATASADLDVSNMTITNDLIIGANLVVNGQANISKLYVTDTLAIGQIAIKDNIIETTASELFIQPSGIGTVNILNSRLIVSDNGNIIINGKITGTEASFSGSLIANLLKTPTLEADVATVGKLNIATESSLPVGLGITDSIATNSASPIIDTVIASDSVAISATQSASITTNATAGTAILTAGTTEIIINNPKLSANSMIYLTPNGSTQNQVVYVKSKYISNPTSDSLTSNFTIALDNPLTSDVTINWWIIN